LYPSRRERKKIAGQNVNPDQVFILVNVVSTYDLPIRKDKSTNDPMKIVKDPLTGKTIKIHEHIAGESLVRPFVEVTFQDSVQKTSTADGPNACWNQEVYLPFKAPNNDFSPESLQLCNDFVHLNVYDELEIDVLENKLDKDTVIHKKILRYWLGSLKIPFSTIYFKSKVLFVSSLFAQNNFF
jgi:coiled-coil and C2 domain-containing protein 2A